jgi:hypothetical protein
MFLASLRLDRACLMICKFIFLNAEIKTLVDECRKKIPAINAGEDVC